jgi:hypothetical protein
VTPRARFVALLVALLGFAGQEWLRPRLAARQAEAGLVVAAAEQEGLAADLAVPTLALGAFRGLVTDYLWLRTMSFRAQGRSYEARQVAEQICRLQPRLPEVWSFLGHDLAYNLAGAVADPEARWRWIQNGIALLRDQGLRHNPGDPDLCFMLARIYADKIGTTTDEQHMLYKARLAEQVEAALAGQSLQAIASDPARAAEVRAALGLEPARMLEVDRLYGPLDWRSCDAHGAYWSVVGMEGAERRRAWRDLFTLRRNLHAALKNVVRRGRVERMGEGRYLAPQLELIPKLDRLFRDALAEAEAIERELAPREETLTHDEDERLDAAVMFHRNQSSAREGFLGESIMLLSEYDREQEARALLARAKKDYPESGIFALDYDDLIIRIHLGRLFDAANTGSQMSMQQTMEGTWITAFRALAMGQEDRYRGLEVRVEQLQRSWDAFLASLPEADPGKRLGIDPAAIRRNALTVAARELPAFLLERLAARLGTTPDALRKGAQ